MPMYGHGREQVQGPGGATPGMSREEAEERRQPMSTKRSNRLHFFRMVMIVSMVVLFSCPVWATPITLVGSDDRAPSNSGESTINTWLNNIISDYNKDNHTSLPTNVTTDFRVNSGSSAPSGYPSFGSNTLTLDIPANYAYLVVHWGGSGGGTYQAYYLTGTTGSITLTNSKYGLSWYEFYGPSNSTSTPEPATMILLGSGLAGVVVYRKKFQKA